MNSMPSKNVDAGKRIPAGICEILLGADLSDKLATKDNFPGAVKFGSNDGKAGWQHC